LGVGGDERANFPQNACIPAANYPVFKAVHDISNDFQNPDDGPDLQAGGRPIFRNSSLQAGIERPRTASLGNERVQEIPAKQISRAVFKKGVRDEKDLHIVGPVWHGRVDDRLRQGQARRDRNQHDLDA
jgi:hypothetical protein